MQIIKRLSIAAAALLPLFTAAQDAVLVIEPAKSMTVKAAGSDIQLTGEFRNIGGEKLLSYGDKTYAIPIKGLLGKQGTMVFEFAFDQPMRKTKSVVRTLAVLRANGREEVGFYTFAKNPILQYRFANGRKRFYGGTKKLPGNKVHKAAFSWDGDKVRCYLDGKLIKESKQEFPITDGKLEVLSLGPLNDRWYKVPAWDCDTAVKSLRLYNRVLSNEEIAKFAGVKNKLIHERYPRIMAVPQKAESAGTEYIALHRSRKSEKSWELPRNKAAFSYDKDNLYVDFNTVFPAKTSILKGHSDNDPEAGVWGFESFELHLRHSGKRYYFGGTVNGGKADSLKNVPNYNPVWDYKSSISMQIDDTFLWQGKIVLPWKAIGLSKAPKELKMNFCRSFFNTFVTAATDLAGQGGRKGYWADDEYFFTLKFPGNAPSMRVIKLGNPTFGNIEQEFEFVSPIDQTVKFYIIQESKAGLLTPQALAALTVNLKANEPVRKKIQTPLTMLQADRLVYKLASENDKEVFFQQDVPLKISAQYLAVTPLYYANKLNVAVKTAILKAKYGKAKLALSMKNPAGKTVFKSGNLQDTMEIPFAENSAVGSYLVEISDNKGDVISGQSLYYPGVGEWSKLSFDMTRIIPPYTAMTYPAGSDFTAQVINRDYVWSKDSFLPAKITSKGENLIKSAEIMVNGKAVRGSFAKQSALKHRAEFSVKGGNSDCQITSSGWLEFDGVQHNQVEVTALKNIKSLELKIVLPAKFAKYLHTSANGWGNKITAKIKNGKFEYKFYPVNFIGNEEKGLCFFAESSRNWSGSTKPFAIVKNDNEAVFTAIIARNLKAGEKITFDYGLLASPVKPQHKRYPLNTASWQWNPAMNRPGKTPTSWCAYLPTAGTLADAFADVPGVDNESIIRRVSDNVKSHKQNNVKPFIYNPFYTSDEYPEVQAFGNEWECVPRQVWSGKRKNKTHTLFLLCPASRGADFFLNRVKKFAAKTKIHGVNFDFGIVPHCDNNHHGCFSRTPLLAYRNFYRKLAMILMDNGVEDYIIHVHNTSSVQLPSYTFVTHLLNGEHIRQQSSTLMHNGKDILDSYPIEMFACELSSMPFGINNAVYQSNDNLMKEYGGGKEDEELYKLRITRAFLSGTLLHNTIISLNRCHHGIFDKLVRIYDKFNVPSSEFIGYWSEKAPKVLTGKDVYASVYKHPTENKLLAVIAHIGNKRLDQDVTVEFAPEKLGMKNFKSATELLEADDPEYQELYKLRQANNLPIVRIQLKWQNPGIKLQDFKNNKVKLHLPAHTFAIVELQ
ncbi:MAG: hypothetical protein J6Q81_00370 [Lentisphaeria bacterium]|nr:hypothetical protein [Lentisphaeria bacterium]